MESQQIKINCISIGLLQKVISWGREIPIDDLGPRVLALKVDKFSYV